MKLLHEQESYDEVGPALPSSRFADDALRLRLAVTYMTSPAPKTWPLVGAR